MSLSKLIHARLGDSLPKRERRKEARPGEVSKGTLFLYFPSKEDLFQAVVRENISGRLAQWNSEFDRFEGSSADMLRYCMRSWWERLGATKASGITKLILSEAHNFPEIAVFYQHEVIRPGQQLIRRILQRGIDRGEFTVPDPDYAIYSVIAPMIFLVMMKHSGAACLPTGQALEPQRYLDAQVQMLLQGMCMKGTA
jgi:TetR/AcrR family transcriptional regulator